MKTKQSLPLGILFYLLFIFSCQKTDTIQNNNNGGSTSTVLNKTLLLQLVNETRQKGCNCGSTYYPPVATVSWDGQLETAAITHADDINKNNYFSHTALDGSSPGDRIRRTGYSWSAYGENIAKGFTIEQAVMDAWIQSEEHCVNIMNSRFKDFGAAKVGSYWVQEFGARF